jgi:hypothetical protein
VFDQLNRDLDLDGLIRTIWRELYTQVVVAMWWATRQYKVRGQTEAGNKRKKEYTLTAPVAMTTLDPTKIVPVGSTRSAPSSYGRPLWSLWMSPRSRRLARGRRVAEARKTPAT